LAGSCVEIYSGCAAESLEAVSSCYVCDSVCDYV
jgi:hypothetical protein